MKKIIYLIFCILVLCSVMPSCKKDALMPNSKENNSKEDTPHDHNTEEALPAEVKLTMASGHFHGTRFHQDTYPKGLKYYKAVQEIILECKEHQSVENGKTIISHKWVAKEGYTDTFVVLTLPKTAKYERPYALWIEYLDDKGNNISGTLVENGVDKHHQHFFFPIVNGKKVSTPLNYFNYVYFDTNPWNKPRKRDSGVELVGSKIVGQQNGYNIYEPLNPIGLKGFFNFYDIDNSYKLKIELMHANGSKFVNNKALPFYTPKKGEDIDWSYYVNIIALPRIPEDIIDEFKEDITLQVLSQKALKFVQMFAKTFNITDQEALDEIKLKLNGEPEHNNGGLWL